MDRLEQKILNIIDAHAEELNAVAMDIYHHAERGFIETETAKIAADYLRKIGLEPREGLALTGLRADIGEGDGPTIALIGELDGITCPAHPDASPSGIAHACGHEAQMAAILGAALALSDPEVKEALGGKAAIFAVPAEEFLSANARAEVAELGIRYSGGKSELIRRGEFDDIDMSLTSHVHMLNNEHSDLLLGNCACTGFIGKTIIIHGQAAHAAQAPHNGINAINAASLGFSALGMIRETFREKDCVRVHPIISEGGSAINVVPDRVVIEMLLRALTLPVIEEVSKKVDRAYEGGAYSIGATAEIIDDQGFLPVIMRPADPVLLAAADVLKEQNKDLTINTVTSDMINTASTDVGDLTHIMPVLNFTFGGTVGSLHSKDFRITDSYKAHIMPAKMMAITAYRLLKDGAAEAKATIADFEPALSREEYLAYAEKLHEK